MRKYIVPVGISIVRYRVDQDSLVSKETIKTTRRAVFYSNEVRDDAGNSTITFYLSDIYRSINSWSYFAAFRSDVEVLDVDSF